MPNKTLEKWEEKLLGEVSVIGAGNSAPQDKSLFEKGVYPFFRTADVGKIHFGKIYTSNDLLNENGIKSLKLFKKGTILIPKSGASTFLNHRVKMGVDGYVVSHLATVKGNNEIIDDDFLLYFLSTIKIQDIIQDQNYPSVNLPIISNIKIALPTIQEQQRIVKILDEAFENIDKAKQNALQNLNNAKELFESYLKEYFERTKNTWQKYKLSEITTKIGSGATPLGGKKAYIDCGISLIRSMNVYDREFIYEGLAHISEIQAKQLDVVTIQEKDVLLNITGASVARCCVVPNDVIPARVNQHVSIIRPKQEIILSKFLCYLLTSNYYKNILLKDGAEGGATRQALTKTGLEQFEVYIPKTLEEQQKIVAQLDELQEQTKKLEQIYEQKIKDLDELKQSILQKAFNGEL